MHRSLPGILHRVSVWNHSWRNQSLSFDAPGNKERVFRGLRSSDRGFLNALSSQIFTREAPVAARWGILAIVVLALGISQCQMAAQASAPLVFLPDKLPWVSPPNNPRLQFAWILGNEQNTGPTSCG